MDERHSECQIALVIPAMGGLVVFFGLLNKPSTAH